MNQKRPDLLKLIELGNYQKVKEILTSWLPFEIADLLTDLPQEQQAAIINTLPLKQAARTFEFLPISAQKEIIEALSSDQVGRLLSELSPDDRTTLLGELPEGMVSELLKLLPSDERLLALKLLNYPENSVGRLMTPDYIAVKANWTVKQVLDYIREHGHDRETINVIYVIDDKGHLLDDIRIREFLLVSPEFKVNQLMDNRFISLSVNDDDEKAINIFRRNNRVALPVIDSQGILLGIVTIDDILNLSKEEDTEDIQKIGGMEALDAPYMLTPFPDLIKKRVGWLVILFLGETLTASAMAFFQDEISKAVVLALFLPLIISSGGNSGSQASTLIIRAMALGEITLKDWWKIMRREILAGLVLGTILGLIGLFRVSAWSLFSNIYGPHWFLVAETVCLGLVGVVLWGTLSGAMLPFILRFFKIDPATSSAPFVATLVDVTGLIIYFYVAIFTLHGTLL